MADPLATRTSFCDRCGTLLATPNSDTVTCVCCGRTCCYGDLDSRNLKIRTFAEAQTDPKWAKRFIAQRDGLQTDNGRFDTATQHRAEVDETCPKCGHGKATFYTMQLRSVDEGQTVFYDCLKCAHTWSQNN
ncbi:DNA-directed RNA polymerase subunit [Hondaea fermentalgiana]|uniref:DNA-directed RNA polymerase subunit n=1 Tax=Hondaea fermentalgiana TaxID=2315210 RepID=A0A2R5GGB3_9STRA|nr:DNA-directed RNA polymerase subunit [Hondaea fermentalgiana]|eukprot:GBG27693.1 DNA-directed RNA polymerase subunit [Hondaea fermentalgiana]